MTWIHPYLVFFIVLPSKLDAACDNGWKLYKATCYNRFPASSWQDADDNCKKKLATLVQVKDRAENNFIQNQFGGKVWIGLSRCHLRDTCLLDFSRATYENWAPKEPDNEPHSIPKLRNSDYAVLMETNGMWADEPKKKEFPFICAKPEDPCKDNFCNVDGSTCTNGKCVCKPGYSGDYCYERPCDSDPCKNGGICKNKGVSYECACVNFYTGKNCAERPCDSKPCKNGGNCKNKAAGYECNCVNFYIGKNCDELPCDSNPCVNAKQCINEKNGFRCECLPNWTGPKCEKSGQGTGDPHYITFDGKRYDFQGKCEYFYAKDCKNHAFDVLQQNEACGHSVSCTKSIRVLFKTVEVVMLRGGVVYVNGQRVSLPWKRSGASINRYGNGAKLSVSDLLFSVRWDGSMGIYVDINQRYEGGMCGLMGNADGNPNNDFQLPDKTQTTDIGRFGNSWKTNPKCFNGIVPADPCKSLSSSQFNNIKTKCNKLKELPFKACNAKITPDVIYIPNCLYDLCAMKQSPEAAWCQALEAYDRVCGAKGIRIDWEGKPGFEDCGNPCSNMPCFNGARCENINRKEFKCTCAKGYNGPKCENVECKSGYLSLGNACYRKMSKRPWKIARCKSGDQFVYSANADENAFFYKNFVEKSKASYWMNAKPCVNLNENKLCKGGFGTVYYNNLDGPIRSTGCAEMRDGRGGKWDIQPNCRKLNYYICKYIIFQH